MDIEVIIIWRILIVRTLIFRVDPDILRIFLVNRIDELIASIQIYHNVQLYVSYLTSIFLLMITPLRTLLSGNNPKFNFW